MHIKNIKIEDLFGLFSYNIDLLLDQTKLMFVTGPNGYGKTTLLKIISSLNESNLYYFYVLKFKSISIDFDDDSILTIDQKNESHDNEVDSNTDEQMGTSRIVKFIWKKENKSFATFEYKSIDIHKAIRFLKYEDNQNSRISLEWNSKEIDSYLLDCPVFNRYIANKQGQNHFLMQLQTIRTKYIASSRIYSLNNEFEELPIKKVENELKNKLESAKLDFLTRSQKEDALFVKDALLKQTDISEQEYIEKSQKLKALADRLMNYMIVGKQEIPTFDHINSKLLSSYIERLSNKLHVCDDFLEKISLFDRLIQSKNFSNKKITFSPQFGMRVVSTSGEFIDTDLLSSGEQNEIVLLYNLIFSIGDKSVLLVDEPENSLHVAWQKLIVNDLNEIAIMKNIQMVVATHSPSIVSQCNRNFVDLYYLDKQNGNK